MDIGERMGRRTVAVLSAMDRPLGRAVGNALEVKEAIAVLRGGGPEDLRRLCLELGSRMLVLAEICRPGRGLEAAGGPPGFGAGFGKTSANGGRPGRRRFLVDAPETAPGGSAGRLPRSPKAGCAGWIRQASANAALILGAGPGQKGRYH